MPDNLSYVIGRLDHNTFPQLPGPRWTTRLPAMYLSTSGHTTGSNQVKLIVVNQILPVQPLVKE